MTAANLYFEARLAFVQHPEVRLCTREGSITVTRVQKVDGVPRASHHESRVSECVMVIAEREHDRLGVGLVAEPYDSPADVARALVDAFEVAATKAANEQRRASLADWVTSKGSSILIRQPRPAPGRRTSYLRDSS